MDRSDERIRRALRRRPYVLNPVRVNSPDSVMWPTGKVHRRPRPSTSAQTPQIHKRPPIIENCGQEQTSGDGRDMNSEPLSQSGRVTRLMERNYDGVISSSNSDDISIYSFTDCESESPGKVSGPVSGLSPLVTSAPRTLAEALQALPSAVARPSQKDVPKPPTPPSPVSVIVASPAVEYLPYHRSPRLAPITNLSENGRKLLQKMSGVTPQERKVKRKKTKGKKQVKKEKASKMQQVENVGERKEDKKEEKKSLRKRFLQWLLPKLRCSKK
ncbi:uncharacterized protein LOC118389988 [Oncorhynchus keta]|uniref:uncharacterized protein LOC118389988 n=1 Tax=Oncorhynchus keta TaxID=8018 RepID=UPI00227B839F|nr:uncharacterized protein LOC118389988 [Oncorhynchus keta]